MINMKSQKYEAEVELSEMIVRYQYFWFCGFHSQLQAVIADLRYPILNDDSASVVKTSWCKSGLGAELQPAIHTLALMRSEHLT